MVGHERSCSGNAGVFRGAGVASLVLLAALLFCLTASATCIFNDMHNIERVRRNSKKSKTCPLAAGVVLMCASLDRFACYYRVLAWGWLLA